MDNKEEPEREKMEKLTDKVRNDLRAKRPQDIPDSTAMHPTRGRGGYSPHSVKRPAELIADQGLLVRHYVSDVVTLFTLFPKTIEAYGRAAADIL